MLHENFHYCNQILTQITSEKASERKPKKNASHSNMKIALRIIWDEMNRNGGIHYVFYLVSITNLNLRAFERKA